MTFIQIYFAALIIILLMMTVLWAISLPIRNASIVDQFWGIGFVITTLFYFFKSDGYEPRKIVLLILVVLWGLRLSVYLALRNRGKGEDPRYQQFRKSYGEHRYWWISYFQVFLLQGILMWLISAPLLGGQMSTYNQHLSGLDFLGIACWITGFIFETGGDLQLLRFKANPANRGKILDQGFWRYTRHPNYFGESAIWCGYGLISISAEGYLASLGSALMIALIIKISGVAMLEKSLKQSKPGYQDYMEKTSTFIPWFPKK